MYKIGEFSKLAKTTVKTLRYYEKEGLFLPSFVDSNGYRYYDAGKLTDLAKIISLRQIGFSIEEIKEIMTGTDFQTSLIRKKSELEKELLEYNLKISKINYLLGDDKMGYEVVVKELPEVTVYYKEGILEDFSKMGEFILKSAEECLALNPDIKCAEPDYSFSEYLDGEYKEKNFRYRYSQAVTNMGKSNDSIKFRKLDKVKAVCVYHKGSYATLGKAYGFIMNYIEQNGYEIIDFPRERYIDGIWNKEDENEWLTEIQVPVKTV